RFSLLPALTTEGVIYSEVRLGSYDSTAFAAYIKELMTHMQPWPAPCMLVMDNCDIHHSAEVAALCNHFRIKLFNLEIVQI
ncbi:hypothetical protein K439DRAFT_1341324, partial [Ramaria rubella]